MMKTDLPIAFLAALSQDKHAMQNFAKMSEGERSTLLSRARQATSKADMQLIADSLADDVSCAENH